MPQPAIAGFVVAIAAIGLGLLLFTRPMAPLDVVDAWVAARNEHDVDEAMSLVADAGAILGIGVHLPGERDRLRSALEAQAVAGWRMEASACAVDGENVTCRYTQEDEILRRWGLALTGEHRYFVHNGRIGRLQRIHDSASQQAVYNAADAFRAWVRAEHPELFDVIWIDPSSALYTTPEGAVAILDLLDEYQP